MGDELDQLLQERFDLTRQDVVAALKTLPVLRPWAAALSDDEARLLNDAGFVEDPEAYAAAAADIVTHLGRLLSTACSAGAVAKGLGISLSRVRQRRLARQLWAIPDGGGWLFPLLQFDRDADGGPLRQTRGLDQVFPVLPPDLHPVAIAGFLHTPHPDLPMGGTAAAPLDWLRNGGDVSAVVALAQAADWVGV
jgi:hypothetical protein